MANRYKLNMSPQPGVSWEAFQSQVDSFLLELNDYDYPKMLRFIRGLRPLNIKCPIVFVEGSIAVGKTSFLKRFEDKDLVVTVEEPVDIWEAIVDSNGKSIFVNYYERNNTDCGLFLIFYFLLVYNKL